MNYKTIRIHAETFEKIDSLLSKYQGSKTDLIEAMCTYFLTTGINPNEPQDVTTQVRKLKDQLISFIRTQEKDKLNPLIKKQDLLIQEFKSALVLKKDTEVTQEFMIKLASQLGKNIVEKLSK